MFRICRPKNELLVKLCGFNNFNDFCNFQNVSHIFTSLYYLFVRHLMLRYDVGFDERHKIYMFERNVWLLDTNKCLVY